MTRRVLLAGVVGGIAMFVWSSIAHVALPLGRAGVQEIAGEGPLLASLQATLKADGLYLFPNMDPKGDQAAYTAKVATGPSGFLVYSANRRISMGPILGTEFLSELAQGLIAAWLLSMMRLSGFGRRVAFYAGLGLIAAIATNVSYWNFYAFPGNYTLAYMTMTFVGYVCAGLAAAAIVGRAAPRIVTKA